MPALPVMPLHPLRLMPQLACCWLYDLVFTRPSLVPITHMNQLGTCNTLPIPCRGIQGQAHALEADHHVLGRPHHGVQWGAADWYGLHRPSHSLSAALLVGCMMRRQAIRRTRAAYAMALQLRAGLSNQTFR